jgi:hypothetical protein
MTSLKLEGASKFAIAAAHRLLASSASDDAVLVAFALLKLHENVQAHLDDLRTLVESNGLSAAPPADPTPRDCAARPANDPAKDAPSFVSDWEDMVQRAINRLKTDEHRTVLGLAKAVAKAASDYQAKTTALQDADLRMALDLAMRFIEQDSKT